MNSRRIHIIAVGISLGILLSACQPSGPLLKYGDDSWTVTSVEACSLVHENADPQGDVMDQAWPPEEAAFVVMHLSCNTRRPISAAIAEAGGDSAQGEFLLRALDDNKFYPLLSAQDDNLPSCNNSVLVFMVYDLFKEGNQGKQKALSLHFTGFTSMVLPQTTYQEDCSFSE